MIYDATIDYKSVIKDQLTSNVTAGSAISQIITSYLDARHRLRELEVRNAQLDKEAGELRQENEELIVSLEDKQRAAIQSEDYIAAKAQVETLRQDLLEAYKEKSSSAEAASTALRQLEIVREVASTQEIELQEARDDNKTLQEQVKKLQDEVKQLSEARDLASKEAESRTLENAKMAARNLALEQENADLACRLIEVKDAEVERMNEMNKMIEDLLANARQSEAAIISEAKQQAASILSAAKAATAGGPSTAAIDAMLDGLALSGSDGASGGGASGKYLLPKIAIKTLSAHPGGCYGAAFDSQGTILATCGSDKVVRLWDPLTATKTNDLRGAHEGLNSVAFTSDTKFVLGAEEKMAIRCWDVRTGRSVASLTGHSGKVSDVACSPVDAATVVSCSAADRSIKVWDLKTGIATRTMLKSTVHSVCFNHTGSIIVSGHRSGEVCFWDKRASTGAPAFELKDVHKGDVTSVSSAINQDLILTCGKDNCLRLIDIRTFKFVQRMSARSFIVGGIWEKACLSPAVQYAAAGSTNGAIIIWNTRTGAVQSELKPSGNQSGGFVTACAWCPTGLPLVSCDKAGGVTFWNGG